MEAISSGRVQSIPLCLKEESRAIFCGVIADNRLSFLLRRRSQRLPCPLNYRLRWLITADQPPQFFRMLRERLQTSTSLLFSGAITLSLPTLLAETITLSLKFRLRPTDRPTARSPAGHRWIWISCRESGQPAPLLNLQSKGVNGKVHPGLKFLPFATCRFVDGGAGEIPFSHIITVLECLIWTNSHRSGSWQPCCRASVDLIVHFDPERRCNHYIFFAKRATLVSKEGAVSKRTIKETLTRRLKWIF